MALDDRADKILRALRRNPDGMSRTAIFGLLGHSQSSDRISAALALLASKGLAQMYARYPGGRPGGRAAEIWTATEERESEESPSEAVSSEEPTKRDDQGAPVTASANRPERGLSDLCIRQLAEWYAEASYRDYSPGRHRRRCAPSWHPKAS
jgi:hypothetical protein